MVRQATTPLISIADYALCVSKHAVFHTQPGRDTEIANVALTQCSADNKISFVRWKRTIICKRGDPGNYFRYRKVITCMLPCMVFF